MLIGESELCSALPSKTKNDLSIKSLLLKSHLIKRQSGSQLCIDSSTIKGELRNGGSIFVDFSVRFEPIFKIMGISGQKY